MSWQTATFPTLLTAYRDHGALGLYTGVANSPDGADAGPWQVQLTHGDEVAHTRTVQSRRHAEYLLRAWTRDREAPAPCEVSA